MTVLHENLRMVAPDDLSDQPSRRHVQVPHLVVAANLHPTTNPHPTTNSHPTTNPHSTINPHPTTNPHSTTTLIQRFQGLQDTIWERIGRGCGLATIIKSTKAFREAT